MPEPKSVQLRPSVRAFAQLMERRRRGRKQEILEGTLPHWKQAPLRSLIASLQQNITELVNSEDAETAARKAADAANYLDFIARREPWSQKGEA